MGLEGKQLGHYRLLGLLGRGGMGDVYLAEDLNIPRRVAIKVVRGEAITNTQDNQNALRLFTREVKAIAALDHPHILSIIDFGEETSGNLTITYLVMPYRPEGSLADWLRRQSERSSPPPTLTEITQLIQQAASALQHAHEHHILHLDVKPSNFLVRELADSPRVPDLLLADFGISRFNLITTSASQNVRGTPTSMAPEHWEGKPATASDQYELGIMAYQLLTGRPPFTGNIQQVMFQHFRTPPTPPSQINAALSADLDIVIQHALAKDPGKRFASVAAFARAFQQAVWVTLPANEIIKEGPHSSPHIPSIPSTPPGTHLQPAHLSRDAQPSTPMNAHTSPAYTQPPGQSEKRPLSMRIIAQVVLIIALIAASISIIAAVSNAQATGAANAQASATAIAQSNLQATAHTQSTAYAQATANVVAANPDPYPFGGQIKFIDLLHNNSATGWDELRNNTGTCSFKNGAYHVTSTWSGYFTSCFERNVPLQDFVVEVQMTIVQGGDCGGIIFRANPSISEFYQWEVCQNGSWNFFTYFNSSGGEKSQANGQFSAQATNTLAVAAKGSQITLYVNGEQMKTVTVTSYSSGDIAMMATDRNNQTDVAYTSLRVWTL